MKQLDLYLIHYPFRTDNGDFEKTWRGFEQAKREGLTKFTWRLSCLNFVTKLWFQEHRCQQFHCWRPSKATQNFSCQTSCQSGIPSPPLLSHWYGLNGESILWQIKLHPYNLAKHASLLAYHTVHGIVTEAYGSLAFVFCHFNHTALISILSLDQSQLYLEGPWTLQ